MEDAPQRESDDAASAAVGRADLAAQLRNLEQFAARTVAAGEELPPQAADMIAHLREIVQALDGLAASMSDDRDAPNLGDTDPRAAGQDRSV